MRAVLQRRQNPDLLLPPVMMTVRKDMRQSTLTRRPINRPFLSCAIGPQAQLKSLKIESQARITRSDLFNIVRPSLTCELKSRLL